MPTKRDLLRCTDTFFSRHWAEDLGAWPTWNDTWDLKGSMPYHTLGGVYCLLSYGRVVYVGVGVSRGGIKYPGGFGLSRRVANHVVRRAKIQTGKVYEIRSIWLERKVDEIVAIGFPSDFSYLALALEDYLICELKPQYNRKRKRDSESLRQSGHNDDEQVSP